jgi:hypothetical protein
VLYVFGVFVAISTIAFEMQQPALCHFFKHDWKQAEPIVSALARSVKSLSSLDPVVWTMLHALALA